MQMTNEIKEMNNNNNNNHRQALEEYHNAGAAIHIVLVNRRFYNGLIIEIKEQVIILNDNKIGRIFVPINDIYLIESFHEPDKVESGREDGE